MFTPKKNYHAVFPLVLIGLIFQFGNPTKLFAQFSANVAHTNADTTQNVEMEWILQMAAQLDSTILQTKNVTFDTKVEFWARFFDRYAFDDRTTPYDNQLITNAYRTLLNTNNTGNLGRAVKDKTEQLLLERKDFKKQGEIRGAKLPYPPSLRVA